MRELELAAAYLVCFGVPFLLFAIPCVIWCFTVLHGARYAQKRCDETVRRLSPRPRRP